MTGKNVGKLRKIFLLKAIIYRILASFVITPLIVVILTGKLTLGLKVGALELVIKTICYYIYDEIWERFRKAMEEGRW